MEVDNSDLIYDSYISEEDRVDQKEITYGDEGEALMVQRLLKSNHYKEDRWLHHNIFHTHCTLFRKVRTIIIDSISY